MHEDQLEPLWVPTMLHEATNDEGMIMKGEQHIYNSISIIKGPRSLL